MKNSREKGNIGEEIACKYLKQRNFFIQNRNYYKKWGEIDIIAVKNGILHFFEVKSIIDKSGYYFDGKSYRPEENVHNLKLRKLRRVIQSYLNDNKYGLDIEFKFHVIAIRFDQKNDKIFIKMLENIIL